mgnify:CR=1 FL=1
MKRMAQCSQMRRSAHSLVRSSGVDDFCDSASGFISRLMFPNPDDHPAVFRQFAVGIQVTALVGFDLLAPELGVGFGLSGMNRTAMPETTIHEDGDTLSPE